MSTWRERLQETRESVERRTGYVLERKERVDYLQEADSERRMLQRDLDLLGYGVLNADWSTRHELKPAERRRLVQRARVVWQRDPQAGAAVDLMNDFVFGRGLTKPKANDAAVQEVIDEAWDDPDNALILTSYGAQLALGTDLELQCNLFPLLFEDGEDGKVKLGLLDHDTVETVVRDQHNRLRILYYVARHFEMKWDFETDQPMMVTPDTGATTAAGNMPDPPTRQGSSPTMQNLLPGQGVLRYYEHWRNVQDVTDEASDGPPTDLCPDEKLGDGKVYHVSINRGMEMAFGHPRMDRLIRWFNSYNNFMDARVDIMAASAAFVMKRKVHGTPQQLQKMATQALSRRSSLGMTRDPGMFGEMGPKAAGILNENESVSHEDFNINTNAPAAAQDAQMLRSQISAATRWPASYYGDASQSNLATATSLELPVLVAVESRQRVFEDIVRFFTDRVIERAVDTGRLSAELDNDEVAAKTKIDPAKQPAPENLEPGETDGATTALQQAYQDEGVDEQATMRDLGYEFQMPSPLKRLLSDIVTAVQVIGGTFDPNNTNTELSRTLLTIALQELDLEDPAGAVERIFPPGYVDPQVASSQGPPGQTPPPFGDLGQQQFGEFAGLDPNADPNQNGLGQDAQNSYGGGYAGGNPYGAVASSQSPEQVAEMRVTDESPEFQKRAAERAELIDLMLDDAIGHVLSGVGNGNGSG